MSIPKQILSKQVLILCPFPQGVAAGQRLKYEQYLDDWRQAGIEVTVSPYMDHRLWDKIYKPGHYAEKVFGVVRGQARRLRDLLRLHQFDLVYVYVYVTPIGGTIMERLTRALARKLVYDIEDDLLGPVASGTSVNPIARFLRGRGKPRYLVRTANQVVTASPFLVERCQTLNRNGRCALIPPSLDTDRFTPGTRSGGKVVVGWTGTFSSEPYLNLLRPMLLRLAKRVDFRLRVIGNFAYSLPGVDVEVITWTKVREIEDMQAIDIGLYPLPDDSWILGKAGLKIIQYMAFGIPSVSSNVGTAPLQIRDGVTGFLVKTDEEWIDRLERLILDPALRARIGAAAREEAVATYSQQTIGHSYRGLLESLLTDVT